MRWITIVMLVFLLAIEAWSETFEDKFSNPRLKLAKLAIDKARQRAALQGIGMEVADAQKDHVIVYATQRQVDQVQQMGVAVDILDADIPQLVKVWIDFRQLDALANLGLDILTMQSDHVQVIASKKQTQIVQSLGFRADVLADNIYRLVQPSPQGSGSASISAQQVMLAQDKYHTYSEVVASLHQLEAEHPDIAQVMDIGDSIEGRDIWAIKISDDPVQDEDQEPDILFVGCHHAREWIAVEVPFRLAHYLIENYETDARVRVMVDQGEIYIVPIVNPDGYVYTHESWTQRFWRKNRRDNGDGTFGVDLNRNYDSAWGVTVGGASSSDPGNELYHGTAPFSEPETRSMRDFMLGHDLDLYMDYHNYGQLIGYSWGHTNDRASDHGLVAHMAEHMARLIEGVHNVRYTPGHGDISGLLYLVSGDATDWVYATFNIPVFMIELRPLAEPYFDLPEAEIIPTFEENLPAALYLIEWTQSTDRTVAMNSADITEGPFREGGEITVTLVGEANGVARFSIEGVKEDIEMVEDETAPGTYMGTYTVRKNDNAEKATVSVMLRDIMGNLGIDSNREVTIDTLAPPIVSAEVTDADNAYVNTDSIHIKVKSEKKAEVMVDLSPLDNTRTTIELKESRTEEGVFEGKAIIKQRNTNPAGIKRLLITAKDRTGNVSEDKLEVVLQKEMTLALAEGINIISVPVEPLDAWKLGDLARLIGPEVTMIGSYEQRANSFSFYVPDAPETSPANIGVRGGEAYIVGMASPKKVTFAGIGWGNQLFLSEGNNFISVPRAVEDWRLNDLAAHIGPAVSAIYGYNVISGQFVKYEPSTPTGLSADLPVEGGAGYMVVMTASATVEFDGPTWGNRGAEAIPSIAPRDTIPFLLIEGMTTAQGTDLPLDGLSVSVMNSSSGLQRAGSTGEEVSSGGYSVVFADFVENRAAQVGDELHITTTDPKAAFGARMLTHQLTPKDIQSGKVSLSFQLLSTPVVSALLLPYPNPFNPDVWLPYQLAKPAHVAVDIYDIRGALVHTLDIGHRPAGVYMSEDEAAHWDGKNLHGESVANGIYFYSIRAGAFADTGKLVLLSK